jgi:hypothetical protein
MRFVNRASLLILVVALLGFNAPACAMTCSHHADSAKGTVSAEAHGGCHDSGADPRPHEPRSHQCGQGCDARALPSAIDGPCAPPAPSVAVLEHRSIDAGSAPVAALRGVAKRARLPDRHTLLQQKTLLQV